MWVASDVINQVMYLKFTRLHPRCKNKLKQQTILGDFGSLLYK